MGLREILLVAAFGALGAIARHLASLGAARAFGPGFPWGTLLVNLIGCVALGALTEAALRSSWVTPHVRLAVGTGLLGAFTTFSTFGVETVRLVETSGWGAAFANVLANVGLGLVGAACGIAVVRVGMP